MHIDLYERFWMWSAAMICAALFGAIVYGLVGEHTRPPSHIETIDPTAVWSDPRFAQRGVTTNPDGSVTVTAIAMMFAFQPGEIRVPAGRPVTFRLTSPDVVHGFEIAGTNANTMVIPGYVAQFTTTFAPGEYLIVCHEYCGLGHHAMMGKLIAEEGL
ncbi:MAG TPA: cytochrome c oxidase subunit II [Gemmatimonadales bacterium]|jgi:cytochrome c oxidase subunit 2|nr:cytochrome c oxidase subunit II [Gemmatimonadales bacterium]